MYVQFSVHAIRCHLLLIPGGAKKAVCKSRTTVSKISAAHIKFTPFKTTVKCFGANTILFVDARRWSESLSSAKRFIGEKQLVWGSVKVLLMQNGCSVWERKEDAEEGGWLIYHLESWLMITVYHNQHLWHTTSPPGKFIHAIHTLGSLLPIPHTPPMGWKWSGHVYVVERTLLLTREFPMADHHLQSRMPSTPAISPTPLPSATKQENK